jgi:hypothetical protein
MNNIKIVRMQNGQEIIGIVNEIMEGQYVIEQPMEFQIQNRNRIAHITMAHYLPVELVAKNEVVLNSKDIVFITNPSKSFSEYYENSLSNIDENSVGATQLSSNPSTQELEEQIKKIMVQAFNDMDDPEERTIH